MSILASFRDIYPDCIALQTEQRTVTYKQLIQAVEDIASYLSKLQVHSVALHAQNSIDWVLVDLACQSLNIVCTPIPLFFSQQQFDAVLTSTRAQLLLSDTEHQFEALKGCQSLSLHAYSTGVNDEIHAPQGTSKITYTSGSTGSPKGVCLSTENQLVVARALVERIQIETPKHLCLLPLPTLLENIAGIYAPLLAKGTVVITNDQQRGFSGSKLVDPQQLLRCISQHTPDSLILVPELLQLLVMATQQGWQPPATLKFIAVGGSRVSARLVERARAAGLPVFQGYGLSECASVVSLCTPKCDIDSTGELLPHLSARLSEGELIVQGNSFLGYLENPESWGQTEVHTGDIASLEDNKITITGRLKNTLINSFGRNISPEWVESEILASGLFSQAVVIGDAQPYCSAILTPVTSDIPTEAMDSALKQINSQLPDYAQIHQPIILSSPMTAEQGLYTENMRPRRQAIYQYFQPEIEQVYKQICA